MAEDVKQKIEEIQNQKIPGEIQRVSGGLKSNLTKSKDRKMEMLVVFCSKDVDIFRKELVCLVCVV